jgi:hypothetical protein
MNVRDNMQALPRTPDMSRLAGLRHRDSIELGADDSAAAIARRLIGRRLAEWSLPEFTDTTWLVGTELVTNCVNATREVNWAGPIPPVRLALHGGGPGPSALSSGGPGSRELGSSGLGRSGPGGSGPGSGLAGIATVVVLAWDASVAAPVPELSGPDAESGRGLAIVTALSAEWGYYYPANATGKVTWAIIERP